MKIVVVAVGVVCAQLLALGAAAQTSPTDPVRVERKQEAQQAARTPLLRRRLPAARAPRAGEPAGQGTGAGRAPPESGSRREGCQSGRALQHDTRDTP